MSWYPSVGGFIESQGSGPVPFYPVFYLLRPTDIGVGLHLGISLNFSLLHMLQDGPQVSDVRSLDKLHYLSHSNERQLTLVPYPPASDVAHDPLFWSRKFYTLPNYAVLLRSTAPAGPPTGFRSDELRVVSPVFPGLSLRQLGRICTLFVFLKHFVECFPLCCGLFSNLPRAKEKNQMGEENSNFEDTA